MKTYLFIVLLSVLTLLPAGAQNRLFAKYADMEHVEYVSITKAMLDLLGQEGKATIQGIQIDGVFPSLEGILLISSGDAGVCRQMQSDKEELEKSGAYDCLLRMRSSERIFSSTYFGKSRGRNELVMFVGDEESLSFIVLYGSFTQKELKELLNLK